MSRISNKVLKAREEEENVEVIGAAATVSCVKRISKNVLSNVTHSPGHRQAGGTTINNQSALRTAPDLCKNVSLQCYLVATTASVV